MNKCVEYFGYFGSIMNKNYARCTREIKSRIVMQKAAFNRKKTVFTIKFCWNWKAKLLEVLHLEHSIEWCWNLDTSASRSEICKKFEMWCWRMEKIRWTDRVRNEEVLLRISSSSSSSSSSKDKRGVPWRTLTSLRSFLFHCVSSPVHEVKRPSQALC
jgi:hypothetical protein